MTRCSYLAGDRPTGVNTIQDSAHGCGCGAVSRAGPLPYLPGGGSLLALGFAKSRAVGVCSPRPTPLKASVPLAALRGGHWWVWGPSPSFQGQWRAPGNISGLGVKIKQYWRAPAQESTGFESRLCCGLNVYLGHIPVPR